MAKIGFICLFFLFNQNLLADDQMDFIKNAQTATAFSSLKRMDLYQDISLQIAVTDSINTKQAQVIKPKTNFDVADQINKEISSSVAKVIEREIAKNPEPLPIEKKTVLPKKLVENNEEIIGFEYKDEKNVKSNEEYKVLNEKILLRSFAVDISREKTYSVSGYEFSYAYSDWQSEVGSDGNDLEIKIMSPTSKITLSGVISHREMVRTALSIPISDNVQQVYKIPLIERSQLISFLNKNDLAGKGGMILVEFNDKVESIDIDSGFEAKIFFDQNFKIVKDQKNANYILFIGTEVGNINLIVQIGKQNYVSKIVSVQESEVSFELIDIIDGDVQSILVYEKEIFGNEISELNLKSESIQLLHGDAKVEQVGVNSYEIKRKSRLFGEREYIEFKHLKQPIYIGVEDFSKEIVVPSEAYIENILAVNNLESLENVCVVQIELSNKLQGIELQAIGRDGPVYFDMTLMERAGKISTEVSERVERIILRSQELATYHLNLKYLDDSQQLLKTFCAPKSYLIEHL